MPTEDSNDTPRPMPDDLSSSGEISRRALLRGAVAAAAVVPLVSCSSGDDGNDGSVAPDETPTTSAAGSGQETGQGSAQGAGQGTGQGSGQGSGGAAKVPVGDATDESWNEPWVWRPGNWPNESLALNVVENQNPGAVIGFGNPKDVLFSYGGSTPGPTIRVRGDEILSVTLRNVLGVDGGVTYVGEYPDGAQLTGFVDGEKLDVPVTQRLARDRGNERQDFCLGEHTNGVHTVHTTNLHTHGLHVRPGRNPDGTHSDNVILRLIPQDDLLQRERTPLDGDVVCRFLRDGDQINFLAEDDQVGQADYEFRLGGVPSGQVHPPGTHWYHPHAHGATADQVSSGMAGFLIVEGDVDDALRSVLVPKEVGGGDPSFKSGDNDYRERLMFIQRVFNTPTDPDSPQASLQKNSRSSADAVNGKPEPSTIFMRPNAVERWRVLNGSVDGKGYRRIMVLKGRYSTNAQGRLISVDAEGNQTGLMSRAEVEEAKQHIHQLAFDGVTLVTVDGRYEIKDLADQGDADAPFPLADFPAGLDPTPERFATLADDYLACFADGDTLRNCYVRPNEVYLGPANRTDLLFAAPPSAPDETVEYSVIALGVIMHADTPIESIQQNVQAPFQRGLSGDVVAKKVGPPAGPGDVVIARLRVTGDGAPAFDIQQRLNPALPDVPGYLLPIGDDEPGLRGPDGAGFRTRTLTYSGWGANALPLISARVGIGDSADAPDTNPEGTSKAFAEFIRNNPDLEGLRYVQRSEGTVDGEAEYVLLAPNTRTMAIDGRKFNPNDPARPRMFLDSAEEWVVYNASDFLWADTNADELPTAQYIGHYEAQPMTFAEGMERFRADPGFQVVSRAVDHPFHMHQNPFWVTRIDVPDADDRLHNILDTPRWMDVVPIPRHRGRVVFRSRFPDFVGTYVNHCHILLHEDNGMMQPVEVTPFDQRTDGPAEDGDVARANCVVRDRLAPSGSSDSDTETVNELYPRPSLADGYVTNLSFVDPNHTTGQTYPGFEVTSPR